MQKKGKGGWSTNDIALLRIILEFLYSKLEIIFNWIEGREKQIEAHKCQAMTQDFSKRKTYKQLISGIPKSICEIFGYKNVSLLFYDHRSESFFSFPPQVHVEVGQQKAKAAKRVQAFSPQLGVSRTKLLQDQLHKKLMEQEQPPPDYTLNIMDDLKLTDD